MRDVRVATIFFAVVSFAALSHCSIPDLPSDGGACPCAPGYSCDRARDVCVRGDASSAASSTSSGSSSTSSAGGSTQGAGGAGGAGGSGVGACGGSSPWDMSDGIDWGTYTCSDASPACEVLPDHVLCCDNVHPIDARTAPSAEAPFAGTLQSSHSWFVCWLRGEPQSNGDSVWYYTSLDDPPGDWGYVAGSALRPGGSSTFDPAAPAGSGLPECPCP
ncbi:MAG TPA: hypothetical protein VHB21_19405 [Minicystis sp.]|nr:hypothetical protein [Minicystis sp.]